jgi:hypothetical protein
MKTINPGIPILLVSIAMLTGPVQATEMPAYG